MALLRGFDSVGLMRYRESIAIVRMRGFTQVCLKERSLHLRNKLRAFRRLECVLGTLESELRCEIDSVGVVENLGDTYR